MATLLPGGVNLGRSSIAGDFFGGDDLGGAGRFTLGTVGTLTLERDLLSRIDITGGARAITIGGDIDDKGGLNASGGMAIGSLRIGGDVIKAANAPVPLLLTEKVGTITVEGSFLRDSPFGNPVMFVVSETLKSLTVRGSIDGGPGGAKMEFHVSGLGPVVKTKAVGGISIGGNVTNAYFSLLNSAQPATALPVIGKITEGGNWTSSTLSAGTSLGGEPVPPSPPAPFNPPNIFKAGSSVTLEGLTIRGALLTNSGNEQSYVAADEIKLLSVGGKKVPLTAGIDETREVSDSFGAVLLYLAEV